MYYGKQILTDQAVPDFLGKKFPFRRQGHFFSLGID
jgi:hypothetical protein